MVLTCQKPNQIGPWFSSSFRTDSWRDTTFIGTFKESFRRARNTSSSNKKTKSLKSNNSAKSLNGQAGSNPAKPDLTSLRSVNSAKSLGKRVDFADNKADPKTTTQETAETDEAAKATSAINGNCANVTSRDKSDDNSEDQLKTTAV